MSVPPPAVADPVRVLLLQVPDWPVRAVRRVHGIPVDTPLALVARGRVHAASSVAAQDGVVPGLTVREAQLRGPGLRLEPHDTGLEARAFDPALRALEAVVPFVHVVRPGVVAVRAAGLSRFYGSEHAAGSLLRAHLHRIGIEDVRAAAADGLFCAERAAAATSVEHPWRVIAPGGSADFLAPLPVTLLAEALGGSGPVALLQRMGIRTLGALAELPESAVHARFGAAGRYAHRLARGLDAPVLRAHETTPDLGARVPLEPPCLQTDAALAAAEQPIRRLVDELGRRSLVCQEVRITVAFESGALDERTWRHPWPFTAGHVHERLRWQLADLVTGTVGDDEVTPDPMTWVAVEPVDTAPAGQHAQGLWGERPDDHVVHAVTRLQRRLGHTGVHTAVLTGGRLLHERTATRPWGEAFPPETHDSRARPWPGSLPGLPPAVVYPHARPASVTGADDAPVRVDGRGGLSAPPAWITPGDDRRARITAWAGPWPINQRWWRRTAPRLDRFQVVTDADAWVLLCDGRRWWAEARYA